MINKITSIRTDFIRNALTDDEWKFLICKLRCPKCHLSGGWWVKMDSNYDPSGEEHYRCPDCKTVHSIAVPHKG